jgi:hypothetical protein
LPVLPLEVLVRASDTSPPEVSVACF